MALSPLLMSQGIVAGMTQQPTAQSTSLEDLTRALSGDFASSLSGGDRLMALSALMRSATRSGRQAGLTPQQVVGDLRQQQVQQIQSRMQIEQLRTAEAQRQKSIAAGQQFAQTLEEPQRVAFLGLPLEQQMSRMEAEAFRPQQLFQVFVGEDGKTYERYQSGEVRESSVSLPPETSIETFDVNGDGVNERVVMDSRTRQPRTREDGTPMFYALGMSPAEIAQDVDRDASRAIQQQNANRPPSGGGGGSGRRNAPVEITDASNNRVIAQWDPQSQQYYRAGTNQVVNRGVNTSAESLLLGGVVGGGTARFGGR